MPYIKYEPELIESKLDHRKVNYPILIEPYTTIRSLSIAFDLRVLFQPKEVSANLGSDKYYIGIRSAVIELNAENGKCVDATEESIFNVDYVTDQTTTKDLKESDLIEAQTSFKPITTKVGKELTVGESKERRTSSRFSKAEKQLSVKRLNNWVQWRYSLPNNDSLVSDLLDEILKLQATFEWSNTPLKGIIKLRPGKLEVFDSERKRYPKFQYLAMIEVLIHKHVFLHKGNVQINYQVH